MKIYTKKQIKDLEKTWIDCSKQKKQRLPELLSFYSVNRIKEYITKGSNIGILVGNGDNGMLGVLVGISLYEQGYAVDIIQVFDEIKIPVSQKNYLKKNKLIQQRFPDKEYHVLVDAVIGIGLNLKLTPSLDNAIRWFNNVSAIKIALDIPSGLGSEGQHLDAVIKVDLTLTYFGLKPGFFLGPGKDSCGKIIVISPDYQLKSHGYELIENFNIPSRPQNFHKGNAGRVITIGGDESMEGAALLATHAAIKSGCGYSYLMQLSSKPINNMHSVISEHYDDQVFHAVIKEHNPVIVIGPGISANNQDHTQLINDVLSKDVIKVIDGGALNYLSGKSIISPNDVITPHYKEAARLLQVSIEEVCQNPILAANELYNLFGCNIVLKGISTIIVHESRLAIIPGGSSVLATAGSGDVLSGIIGGFIAQFGVTFESITNAICTHAEVGEYVGSKLGNGLTADDLVSSIPIIIKYHTC